MLLTRRLLTKLRDFKRQWAPGPGGREAGNDVFEFGCPPEIPEPVEVGTEAKYEAEGRGVVVVPESAPELSPKVTGAGPGILKVPKSP